MGKITIATINNAITSELKTASGIPYTQSFDQMTEGIQDTPLLRIYPTAGEQDPGTETDRTSLDGKVKQSTLTFQADLYVIQRHEVGEDMALLIPWIDKIYDSLELQTRPIFGIEALRAFWWNWAGIIFSYGRPEQKFVGARFTLNFRIF